MERKRKRYIIRDVDDQIVCAPLHDNVTDIAAGGNRALVKGRRLTRVCTENSNSNVLVVQPTDERMRRNASGPLNGSGSRCILVQGTMCPRLIVVACV